MKTFLLFTATASLLFGSLSEANAATDPARVLTTLSSFGDFMGTAPDNMLTAQKCYLYNQQLQIVAVVETARGVSESALSTQYYNPYIYDAQGNLTQIERYQYGLYDYGDRAMHAAAGAVAYRYDAQGNCIEEIEDQNVIAREFDADGNCIKEVHSVNGNEGKTLEFSDFSAGKNLPAYVVSSHSNDTYTGEFYEEEREYDAEGRLVKATRLCNRDYVENHGIWSITTAAGDFMQEEHWNYNGAQLASYEKFTSINEETGDLIPYLKTVYTAKNANTVGFQSYTYFSGDWYKSGVYQEEGYSDFTGMLDETAIEVVSVTKSATGLNDADVEFTKPSIANSNANVSFNIYRNGDLISNVKDGNAALTVSANGNYVYHDSSISSGMYEYIVQTVVDNGRAVGYCASNIMSVDLTLSLPAVTNVRAVASVKDQNNYNYVSILFKMPDDALNYGFVSNELIVGNAQIGEDSSRDASVNILHCTISDDQAVVSVLTRYQLGKAISEATSIDINHLSSIEQVRELDDAEMRIFDIQGRQVNAPLEELHGSYIILSGKKAYKVVLK